MDEVNRKDFGWHHMLNHFLSDINHLYNKYGIIDEELIDEGEWTEMDRAREDLINKYVKDCQDGHFD